MHCLANADYLNSKRANGLEFALVTLVFLISPALCFPLLLIGAYNQKKYAYFYISLFMGLLSMFYYPQGDQFRYMLDFKAYKDQPFSDIINFDAIITIRNLNLITLTLFQASKIDWFSLEKYRMVIVSLGCGIVMYMFWEISKTYLKLDSKSFLFKLFLILLLATPVYYISQGFRSGLGSILLCLGLFSLLQGKKTGYLWMLIAALIHFSYLPLGVLFILGLNLKIKINNRNFLLYFSIFIAVAVLLILVLYEKNPFIKMMLDIYVFGSYGREFVWNAYRIKEVLLINGIPTIIFYLIFLASKKDNSDYRFTNIIYLNLALLVASLPFQALFQRFGILSVLLLALYSVMNYKAMRLKKFAQVIILSLLVSTLYPYFMHRYCYYLSNIETFWVYPVPLILENTYDVDDVNSHLDSDGVLKPQFLR